MSDLFKTMVESTLSKLQYATLKTVWASAPEILVDGYGKERHIPGKMGLLIAWASSDGFGELRFEFDGEELVCNSENMGEAFVEAVMIKFARSADLMMVGKGNVETT